MTDDTLHTLHTADITLHSPYLLLPPLPSPSPLHLAIASSQFSPLLTTITPTPHTSIHCLFLYQRGFLSSTEALARYVNEVNRIVACGEAAQLSQSSQLILP